ncbi:MAG: hypothetical protein WCT04_09275 [Planctomycetota bacterium]
MGALKLIARVTPAGRLLLAEKVNLKPGNVVVTIRETKSQSSRRGGVSKSKTQLNDRIKPDRSQSKMKDILAELDAMTFPPDPHPDKSDDELIYGS